MNCLTASARGARILILAVLMLATLAVGSAFALTTTIRPDGVSATGSWSGVTAGNLSDASDGTAASTTVADTFSVTMANDAAYAGATISDATLYVRAQSAGSGGPEKISFGDGTTTAANISVNRGAYTDLSISLGALSDAQVDALVIDVTSGSAGETIDVADVWVVVTYTTAGPSSTLTDCGSCHDYPPADSATRGTPEGAVVGDHQVHLSYTCNFCHEVPLTETSADFAHRNGIIKMKFNTIGDAGSGDNGNYSRETGSGFAQSNSPTTGTCSNVDCHNNTVTPQWGVGTTDCTSCHGAPPATNAHAAHYTAKGWTSPDTAGANCATCHPGDHDGIVEVNAGLAYAANSCGTPGGLGCHNDYATPDWTVGGAVCTDCHTAGGLNAADPVSGLHDETPVVSGVIHNPSDANFSGCEDCHTAAPSASHWDGTVDTPTTFAAGVGYSAGAPATCTASACHSDGGAWQRKWHENSDLTDGTQCAGCHGDWTQGWNAGVTHRTDANPQTTHGTGTNYECKDCHALEAATGYTYTVSTQDWGSEGSTHGNNSLNINNNGPTFARGTGADTGKSGCSPCHAQFDGTTTPNHSFVTTSWTVVQVSGDTINAGCDSCHGGSGDYFPTVGAAYPKRPGRHLEHMTQLASRIGYGAYPWTDAEQKHMCEYCHNDAAGVGGGGHNTDSGDSIADVGSFDPIWDTANPPTAGDNGTFTTANQTCSNVDCHNNKTTAAGTFGWRDAGTSTCTMCHVGGTTDPTSGLHTGTPTVSGVTHDQTLDASECAVCHTSTPSATHIDGTADTPSTFDAAIGFNGVPNPPTCTASACHSDGGAWERQWHANATASNGTECAGCHGDWTQGWNTGVSHRTDANPRTNHGTGTNYECSPCHNLEASTGYTFTSGSQDWGTEGSTHGNGQITVNSNGTTFARGTGGSTGLSGCAACHGQFDGTTTPNHSFPTTSWTLASVAGDAITADCNGCHDIGTNGAPVITSGSSHVDADGASGTYTAGTCTDCHSGHADGTTGVNDVEISTDVPIFTAGTYSTHAGGAIRLGGDATSAYAKSTEAELCWSCHDTNGISEWGKTWGSYQTGTVSTSNWTTANWSSAITAFSYKNGNIGTLGSVHGTAGMVTKVADGMTMKTGETPADISCTYCHDVHKVGKTAGGFTPAGIPYLRGNWTSNVYTNDGAPQPAHDGTWTEGDSRGVVPRAAALLNTAGNNEEGGWQIEQNNGRNDSAQTYANFGGLCQNCHTEAGITGGWGPHGSVVAGFAGGGEADIFDNSYRGGGGTWDHGHIVNSGTTDARGQAAGKSGYIGALRNSNQWSDGINPPAGKPQYSPLMQPAFTAGAVTTLITSGTVAQANFHNFMCSKCHQPHASRLPRLMITNCLDVNHNQWDNGYNPSGWAAGSFAAGELAYSPTAGNCHRYVDGGDGNSEAGAEAGWNIVTPWDHATGLPFN